jgi:hypothetical protein
MSTFFESVNAVVFDVEIFPNFALIGALDMMTGAVKHWSSEPEIGGTFADARAWFETARQTHLFIGFNSSSYDNHLLRAILVDGIDDPAVLYQKSVKLINNTTGDEA